MTREGHSQEEEGDDKPCDEVDAQRAVELAGGRGRGARGVGIEDAGAGNVEEGE